MNASSCDVVSTFVTACRPRQTYPLDEGLVVALGAARPSGGGAAVLAVQDRLSMAALPAPREASGGATQFLLLAFDFAVQAKLEIDVFLVDLANAIIGDPVIPSAGRECQ